MSSKSIFFGFQKQSFWIPCKCSAYRPHHYSDGASRSSWLYFRDGVMRQVFGFTDPNETGGACEIIPQAGDTFTILEKWLDLDASGQVSQPATQEGPVLTI
ncbi:MAG TPA: hypothetical protein VF498_02135, partial [Anaerolineales bacterium]